MIMYYNLLFYRDTYKLILKIFEFAKIFLRSIRTFEFVKLRQKQEPTKR